MIVTPRVTPDRDSRYMGLAWWHASFSKDPKTHVGAQIVSADNVPLGSGYNGPPRRTKDEDVNWSRDPLPDDPDGQYGLTKHDVVIHAEKNAIRFSRGLDLTNATLYVTALPCPSCMDDIILEGIGRVCYMEFRSDSGSLLQTPAWRLKTFAKARKNNIRLDLFSGNLDWMGEWMEQMKKLGVVATK